MRSFFSSEEWRSITVSENDNHEKNEKIKGIGDKRKSLTLAYVTDPNGTYLSNNRLK